MGLTSATAADLNVTYDWYRTFTSDVTTSNINSIVNAPEGDYYVSGYYNKSTAKVMWGDTDITPAGGFNFSFQQDGMVARMSADGNLKWQILPNVANFSSGALYLAPTSDGGVVLATNATFNKAGEGAPVLVDLTDAKGTKLTISYEGTPEGKSPYTGLLIKFSQEGAVEWHRLISGDTELESIFVEKPVTLSGVVTDAEGNIYVAGSYLTKIDLGNDVTAPQALNTVVTNGKIGTNGDAFLAKFTAEGTPVKVLTNSGSEPYATRESVSAITLDGGKLYCAVVVDGAPDRSYTLFGQPAEIDNAMNNNLAYAEIDCSTLECTRAAGAQAAFTEATDKGNVLQIKGTQVSGNHLYICGGLNGALKQNGTQLAASTSKQIQTLTLGIDLNTFDVAQAYECGAGIGQDFSAIADEGAGNLYTLGYMMAGGNPVSLRRYDITTGDLKADNVLFKGGSILTGLFNNSTRQFLVGNYTKTVSDVAGSTGATFPSFGSFSGFLLSFTLPDVNADSGITAPEETESAADAPVEYFNLQGMRISNPAAGALVIRRCGSKAGKVIF